MKYDDIQDALDYADLCRGDDRPSPDEYMDLPPLRTPSYGSPYVPVNIPVAVGEIDLPF